MSDEMKTPETNSSKLPWLGRKLLWLDNMKNVDRIVYALFVICGGLVAADFMYHKHSYLDIEDIPGFYAAFGFFMCAALIVCARAMRVILKRDEDYYSPKDVVSEGYPEDQLSRETIPGDGQ
ncbi:hypothetical protein RHODOSMS8_01165 [Rhodobiaceae bacterium]|nr:hypothetical protein RHODOSMS8_01165 [Rhodobiaceae bacterium]